ncbi:MAG: enoyl-CoA hydratase/isomerase family protein [Pseudomonadota bacterium]
MSASGVDIRIEGRVGRITIDRPSALNALTHGIVRAVTRALREWATEDAVAMLVIDAAGEKAFCAGGDLQDIYAAGKEGDAGPARAFWQDEYRMNALLFEFPKPVATFLQGFTLGGGVGLGCHGSHRIVGETSQIAMPEVSIGLMPDVGGSLLLARCPGRLGEYLGTTATRMGPGCALHAEFADYFVPEAEWPALKAALIATGDWEAVDRAARPAPDSPLKAQQAEIDHYFGGETLGDILRALAAEPSEFTQAAERRMARNAPLAMACAIEAIHRMQGPTAWIRRALDLEYRYVWRAIAQGDFIEGIRAQIIDKDRAPRWRHAFGDVPLREVSAMLMPLGADALDLEGEDV